MATNSLWLKEGISVLFNYEAQKGLTIQVFHCPGINIPFSEASSVRESIEAGTGKAEIFIPTHRIERLRIDTGSEPAKFEFSNLQIVGRKRVDLYLNQFNTKNIQNYSVRNGKGCVISTHYDPYLVYQELISIERIHTCTKDFVNNRNINAIFEETP